MRKISSTIGSDAVKKKMDEINEIVQKMSTEMYQKASQEQASKQKPSEKEENDDKDENVVDADYKVDDEKKKKKK